MKPQFSIRSLLWLTATVACTFGGYRCGRYHSMQNFEKVHRAQEARAIELIGTIEQLAQLQRLLGSPPPPPPPRRMRQPFSGHLAWRTEDAVGLDDLRKYLPNEDELIPPPRLCTP